MGVVTSKSLVIDGKTYTAKTYPATEGLRLLALVSRLLTEEHLKLMIHGDDGGLSDDELKTLLDDARVSEAVALGILQKVAETKSWALPRDFLAYTTVSGAKVGDVEAVVTEQSVYDNFDDLFAGNYKHLVRVLLFAGRVGFGGP